MKSETAMSPDARLPRRQKPRRRILRRLLYCGAALLVFLALVVVFLPVILSSSAAEGAITSRMSESLGGRVHVEDLSLSWFGGQEIRGLRITVPETAAPFDELLNIRSIQVASGLLPLVLASGREIAVELVQPVVRVRRDEDGRFSYEGLASRGIRSRPAKTGTGPPSDAGGYEGLRDLGREVAFKISGGELHYRDDKLGASSEVSELNLDLQLRSDKASVSLAAVVRHPDRGPSAPGRLELEAALDSIADAERLEDAVVHLKGRAENVELLPYRALLEELAGFTPPSKPLNGRFDTEARDGHVAGTLDLDAGFAALESVSVKLPLNASADTRPQATLRVPFSVDLAALATSFPKSLPAGSRIAGGVRGSIDIVGPLSLAALRGAHGVPGRGWSMDLDLRAENFSARLPAGDGGGEAGAASPEKRADAEKPLELVDEKLSLRLQLETGDGFHDMKIRQGHLEADGLDLDVSGSVASAAHRPAAVSGDSKKEAEGRRVDLVVSADVLVPSLLRRLSRYLPADVKVASASRARLRDLTIRALVGGDRPMAQTLEAKGRIEIDGQLRYMGASVDGIRGEIRHAARRLALENVVAAVNGGSVRNTGVVLGLGEEQAPFELKIEAAGVEANYKLSRWLAYVLPFVGAGDRQAELRGRFDCSLEIKGRGYRFADLEKHLSGSGRLRVGQGQLNASQFIHELGSLLGTSLDRVLFEQLGSDFEIGAGKVRCENVFLNPGSGGKIRRLGLEGTTWFDQKIDFGVNVSVLRSSVGDRKIQRILAVAETALGDRGLPLRLRGTLSAPTLALDLKSAGLRDIDGLLKSIPGLGKVLDSGKSEGSGEGGERSKRLDVDDFIDIFRKKKRK